MKLVEIIGHRGFAADFPENTLPSLLGALAAGADALEWDIQVAADGVPVLFHDEHLDRTTDGRGPLRARTSKDLERLDAGSWLSVDFIGTRIPTLAETLERLSGSRIHIYPELKAVRKIEDLGPILELLRASSLFPRTTLISLDHDLLDEVRRRDSEIRLGWVVAHERDMERSLRKVVEDGRALLDPASRILLENPSRTREIASAGIPLVTWTVDRVEEAQELHDLGVRRFTTNEVARLAAWARASEAGRTSG